MHVPAACEHQGARANTPSSELSALARYCLLPQPLEVASFGLPRLLGLAGRLLMDNTPEAREAGRRLVGLLAAAFADGAVAAQLDVQVRGWAGWAVHAGVSVWHCAGDGYAMLFKRQAVGLPAGLLLLCWETAQQLQPMP